MHLLLAAGFMLYYFHASKNTVSAVAGLLASSTQTNVLHKVAQNNSYVGSTSS